VTRRWSIVLGRRAHEIALKIGEWSAKRTILADGRPPQALRSPGFGRSVFSLDGHEVTVIEFMDGRAPRSDLVIDGRSISGGQPRPPLDIVRRVASGLVLVALTWALSGGFLWYWGVKELRLALDGATVAGEVVALGARGNGYYLTYEFAAADGKTRRGEISIDAKDARAWFIRAPVEIGYVRSDPDLHRPVPANPPLRLILLLSPILYLLLSAWLIPDVRRALRTRALLRAPMERTLRVTATVERTNTERNGLMTINYRYIDGAGAEWRGRSQRLYPEEALAYEAGDAATIVYHVDDTSNSLWQGAADPSAVVWRPELSLGSGRGDSHR